MIEILQYHQYRMAYGFDSFEGLPLETVDGWNYHDWIPGQFNAQTTLGCKNKDITINHVYQNIINGLVQINTPIQLISGFYDEVLRDSLVYKYRMKPAKFIEIDCDIYSSALISLDFMCRNHLVVPGTLWYFDDYGGTLGNAHEFQAGESRAYKEICEKYQIETERIYSTEYGIGMNVFYEVKSIGK